jgi:hypothetical protein
VPDLARNTQARPRKDGLDYFPHDTDAHLDDEKLCPFRALHGLAGIGFFWEMLERIYRTAAGELKMNADYRRMTCQRMSISEKLFMKFQADALRLGLFSRKDFKERGILTSSGIKKRFNVVQGRLWGRVLKRQCLIFQDLSPNPLCKSPMHP